MCILNHCRHVAWFFLQQPFFKIYIKKVNEQEVGPATFWGHVRNLREVKEINNTFETIAAGVKNASHGLGLLRL